MGIFGWSMIAGALAYLAERVTGDIEEATEEHETEEEDGTR